MKVFLAFLAAIFMGTSLIFSVRLGSARKEIKELKTTVKVPGESWEHTQLGPPWSMYKVEMINLNGRTLAIARNTNGIAICYIPNL